MRRIMHHQPGKPLAIRHGDVLLTVPNMHPETPPHVRVEVFQLVLRRLYGEAFDLAQDVADEIERVAAQRARVRALLEETPHRNRRGLGAAMAA